MSQKVKYSVVIPVYNSKDSLLELHERLVKVFEKLGETFEIILIDDCSRDSSWKVMQSIHDKDNRVKIIQLMRNFGQDNGNYQVVAENIDNLQFRYLLSDGTSTNNPAGQEPNVRAVEISLLARTANINRGYIDPNTYSIGDVNYTPVAPDNQYRRKLLCSIVKTRNIGL